MNCSTIAARGDVASFGLLLIAVVLLASCSTNRTTAPANFPITPAKLAARQPLTQEQASEECWSETERGEHGAKKGLPLDKRAKIVDKCVQDKMSGTP
jgi:hypothetical protein